MGEGSEQPMMSTLMRQPRHRRAWLGAGFGFGFGFAFGFGFGFGLGPRLGFDGRGGGEDSMGGAAIRVGRRGGGLESLRSSPGSRRKLSGLGIGIGLGLRVRVRVGVRAGVGLGGRDGIRARSPARPKPSAYPIPKPRPIGGNNLQRCEVPSCVRSGKLTPCRAWL